MSTVHSFTDANGNVFLHGQEVPELRAVGFAHRFPCPQYAVASITVGKPYGCDCGGTTLLGWRDWWPLPDEPTAPASSSTRAATMTDLGWWTISGAALLDALRRVAEGADPDLVYAELYANSETEDHRG